LSLLGSRSGRFLAALGFAGVVAVAALVHHAALLQPAPQQDEPDFVEAAELVAAGGSPYDQEKYNYPPPFAELGAVVLERGGMGLFLAVMRGANLLAVAGLALFAAGFAGLSSPGRFALAAALVALLPIVHYTFWVGNTTPVAVGLALAGWHLGRQRPLLGAVLVGVSVAFKPIALVGALYLSARWLLRPEARRSRASAAVEALAWAPVTALCLLPWAGEIPALLQRMAEPPIFSPRNLSLRRVFDGFGIDLPAAAITLTVLAVALVLAKQRTVDDVECVHTRPSSRSSRCRSSGHTVFFSSCPYRWLRPGGTGSAERCAANRRGGVLPSAGGCRWPSPSFRRAPTPASSSPPRRASARCSSSCPCCRRSLFCSICGERALRRRRTPRALPRLLR
jgi:hypothetical protein